MMLERDRTYNDVLDRIERLEMRIEDLRDVARPAEVVIVEEPNWQAVAGWVSTGTVLQDVNGRIVLDPTIPRILIDADGYIESADFVAGTSGFRIDGGTAEFNDIVIRGTIYASVGIIGGWTITATQLKAAGDVILLDSSGVITVGGAGYLQSNPFTSGTQGWRITPTEAEFGNITARGEIRTAVFKYGEVHAQAGQLLVTPNAAKLDADLTIAVAGAFYVGEAGRFGGGDIVRLKDGVSDVWLTVTADIGGGFYSYTRSSGSAVGTVFRAGTAVVGYGASGEGGIVLDAVTANGPFMDIFTHAGAPWTTLTTKVRVGNLAGIVDADLSPTGYGFYSDNAFLKGKLLCGAGNVLLDADGIKLIAGSGDANSVKWYDAGVIVGKMLCYKNAGNFYIWIENESVPAADKTMQIYLQAYDNSLAPTDIIITSKTSTQSGGISMRVSTVLKMGLDDSGVGFYDEASWWSGGNKYASISELGAASFALDVKPDSDGRGLFARVVNRTGISTYDDHFRSGIIPAGYAWQAAPFGGTPAVGLGYNISSDFVSYFPSASTRYFLSRAVTNAGANWQNKSLYGRFYARTNGRHGLRFDDGTDNNYSQVYVTGEANNGTLTASYQYRTGGGAVTTVTSAINIPASECVVLHLLMYYSAPNYTALGYITGEDGLDVTITSFSNAVAWAPVAGRAGLFGENPSVSGSARIGCDWLKNEFV